ncbi:hypothetical protein [Diaphorobacter sp. LR2014-1]|uniref:hypothetical protein n=1 Tax=Diaphorobacter sp. LR2014-1 TaxID=1933219 RepID=UPI000CDB14AB|nr:hypothetical protein [Diaphorobacter sp. LR2014-1]POR10849.1 hypothetical protein BV908_08970 [Diaphorobacter sp. LR2014-1]
MLKLYTVYQNGKRACGVSVFGAIRHIVHTLDGRVESAKDIALEALGTHIGDLLRQGYKPVLDVAFLSEKSGFQTRHPDFDACDGKYTVYCKPSDIAQAVKEIETLASAMSFQQPQRKALMDWLRTQDMNSEFVVADKAEPVFAILLAEVATRNGWALHSSSDGIPAVVPSADIQSWFRWLSIPQEKMLTLKSALAMKSGGTLNADASVHDPASFFFLG